MKSAFTTLTALLVFMSALALLPSCEDRTPPLECSPVRGIECPAGWVCDTEPFNHACRQICQTTGNCDAANEACLAGLCMPYSATCAASDPPCAEGWSCDPATTACRRLLPLGTVCAQGSECASGLCADGVCCDLACTGVCMACTLAANQVENGSCLAVTTGSDPNNDCPGSTACGVDSGGTPLCILGELGAACGQDGECAGGHCADGLCCDAACNGPCESCRAADHSLADGTCAVIPDGTDPANECATTACNGQGGCWTTAQGSACNADFECTTGFCVDGACCNTACDGLCESCLAGETGNADGTCDAVQLGSDPRGDCAGSAVCDGSRGCLTSNIGSPCTTTAECNNSLCVDGLCCNALCSGTCESCRGADHPGQGAGFCANIVDGSDPDAECPGTAACDGQGACWTTALGSACSADHQCSSGFCADGLCCDTACGATCESCLASATGASSGSCAPVANGQDPNNECGAAACDGNGACWAVATGSPCAFAHECSSGFCSDSLCCNKACDLECEACDGINTTGGTEGTCTPILNGFDPLDECAGAPACNGSGSCWARNESATCGADFECVSDYCCGGQCEAGWVTMTSPTTNSLLALWAGSPVEIWAVGTSAGVFRYDGNTWLAQSAAQGAVAVDGAGSDVLVLFRSGTSSGVSAWAADVLVGPISFDNGGAPDVLFAGRLNDVLIVSSTEAYVVGNGGTILRWQGTGTNWLPMASPTTLDLHAVWQDGQGNIFVAGNGQLSCVSGPIGTTCSCDNVILALSGGTWLDRSYNLATLAGGSSSGAFCVGTATSDGSIPIAVAANSQLSTVYRLNGTTWVEGESVGIGVTDIVAAGSSLFVTARSEYSLLTFPPPLKIAGRLTGGTWTVQSFGSGTGSLTAGTAVGLEAIAAVAGDPCDVIAVGAGGTVVRR